MFDKIYYNRCEVASALDRDLSIIEDNNVEFKLHIFENDLHPYDDSSIKTVVQRIKLFLVKKTQVCINTGNQQIVYLGKRVMDQ
ncbi:MAG: hypothetical protein JWO06_4058 [Bacteroidota bacterium]|nr:hypothetical protein [Bacteroidota bacterium]